MENVPQNNNENNEDIEKNSNNESLDKVLSELSAEDAEMVREEFKILNKAVIPGLVTRIGLFKLLSEQSEEIRQLAESGRMPLQMTDRYGTQEDLDNLLEELNSSKKYVEALKDNLLNKDIEAIKKERKNRMEILDKKLGRYSLTGEEYRDREDRTNRKIDEEQQIKQIRADLDNLMNPN